MSRTFDHEYPPADWTAAGIQETLDTSAERFPIPRYADAEFWSAIEDDPLTGPIADHLRTQADAALEEPMPRLTASRFLAFSRTGDRWGYERRLEERWTALTSFALAECLDREDRYLDAVLDYAWAICKQTSWLVAPMHDADHLRNGLPRPVPAEERSLEIYAAIAGKQLAELDHLLGDRLHPALRERIRHEVDRRLFRPYESRTFDWMRAPVGNHLAVANAGVGVAALHLLEDTERQARILETATRTLRHYLDHFDDDGCTAEGLGYWNYGFGRYVQLAAHLRTRTGGACDLFSPPIVAKIARYPLAIELSPGHTPPFSDSNEATPLAPFAACRLGLDLDDRGLAARGRLALEDQRSAHWVHDMTWIDGLGETLRNLAWAREVPADWPLPTPPRRRYFEGYQWWLSRVDPADPDSLVVAAKGGHNGEPHNHNDCGSFVVHVGGESLLTDLGCPDYTRAYFGEDRYDHLVTRSLGHSVPYVDGYEQAVGPEHAATVLERQPGEHRDAFAVDLADCYPDAAGIETLRRRFELVREPDNRGRVTVTDRFRFGADASDHAVESVLVADRPMEASNDGLRVRGMDTDALVTWDDPDDGAAGGRDVAVTIDHLEDAVDVASRTVFRTDQRDVWRARLRLRPARESSLRLTVEPVPTAEQ